MIGGLELAGRKVPVLSTEWTGADHRGAALVRWGVGRYDYRVEPGLYAVGSPGQDAPVLVTANYKLTLDVLRRELTGIDAFVLVLETMGINVWCAAGKGTFGTEELCSQVEKTDLGSLLRHRRLILPQLGAPGVAAHVVRERTGFKVKYGPVEAQDLPRFLRSGKASEEMRRKRFPLRERASLVPMELVPALKYAAPLLAILVAFAALLGPAPTLLAGALGHGGAAVASLLAAVVSGAVLLPLLLPWLPGRAFATKGALLGLVVAAPAAVVAALALAPHDGWWWLDALGLSLLGVAASSFLAMSFTGSSTYTSLSGVEKEMRWAVPAQLVLAGAGLVLWGASTALLR